LTAKEFDAGNSPFSIASGDVDNDGNLDFVVTNTADAKASVLIGNGDGTFKPPASFPVGICPVAVALASLDGGTKLDLKREPAKLPGPPKVFGPFITDPRALYDRDTSRWFVTALLIDTDSSTGNFLPHSEILLAVSDTSDATGSFTQYSIDVTDSDSPECPCVGDQPLLGINEDGIYITTDQFAFSDFSFKTVLVLAIDKFSLAQGTSLRAVSLKTLQQDESPGFAIQPAITLNRRHAVANHGTEFLMNSLDFSGRGDNQLSVWALMNTPRLGSPRFESWRGPSYAR
jgi:hypothetical protein